MRETIEAALARLYLKVERAVDDLPYTTEFDRIREGVRLATGRVCSHREVWVTLMRMRKDKGPNKLPTKREGRVAERKGGGLGAFR